MGPCEWFGGILFCPALGKLELIGKSSAFTIQATASISVSSYPTVCKLCGPTQQSHIPVHCVLDGPILAYMTVGEMGPCKWLGAVAFSIFWANSNSSARETHSHGGATMQECRLTALLMSAHYVGPHNSLTY